MKKSSECRLEPVLLQCSQLQEEVSTLKTQLKGSKQQLKALTLRERQTVEVKVQHEEEVRALHGELQHMRSLLDNTGEQLKREGEARIRDLSKVKQGQCCITHLAMLLYCCSHIHTVVQVQSANLTLYMLPVSLHIITVVPVHMLSAPTITL